MPPKGPELATERALQLVPGPARRPTPLTYGCRGRTDLDALYGKVLRIAENPARNSPIEAKGIATATVEALLSCGDKDPTFFDRPDEAERFACATAYKLIKAWHRANNRLERKKGAFAEWTRDQYMDTGGIPCSPYGNPYLDVELADRLAHINRAIQRLGPRCRHVAYLIHTEKLEQPEVAALLHIAVGAVHKAWSLVKTAAWQASEAYDRDAERDA